MFNHHYIIILSLSDHHYILIMSYDDQHPTFWSEILLLEFIFLFVRPFVRLSPWMMQSCTLHPCHMDGGVGHTAWERVQRKKFQQEVEGLETSSCLIHINFKANCKQIICKMFSQSRQKFPLLEIVKYIQHKVPSTSSSPSPSSG